MSENKPDSPASASGADSYGKPASSDSAPKSSTGAAPSPASASGSQGTPDGPPRAAPPKPTSPATEEAAARSATDDVDSASTVTPTDPQQARAKDARDAVEARASAAQSTAKQEAEVREARDAATAKATARAHASGDVKAQAAARSASAGASSEPKPMVSPTPDPDTANTVGATTVEPPVIDPTATAPTGSMFADSPADLPSSGTTTRFGPTVDAEVVEARPVGSTPAGFGSQPDFTAQNPPPPGSLPPSAPRYLKHNDSAWSVFGRIIAARARQIFDRAGQRITQRTLRIGVSARIFHPEPGAKGLRGKTLQYLEESIAHWVMSRDVLVFMIPTVGHQGMLHPSNIRLRDYARNLDGLLLQGGADVAPQSYAENSTDNQWPGDRVRDMYELELLHEFVESGKPVFGVCRGCQLINVAFGGTLYQDIATEVPTAGVHVNEHYDQHRHSIHFPDGSTLASMFPDRHDAIVNSIHHQAIKTLGRDLNIEAVSGADGIIEAIRYRRSPFVMGVQWHPEFHRAGGPELLDCTPLLDTFLRVARETRF